MKFQQNEINDVFYRFWRISSAYKQCKVKKLSLMVHDYEVLVELLK